MSDGSQTPRLGARTELREVRGTQAPARHFGRASGSGSEGHRLGSRRLFAGSRFFWVSSAFSGVPGPDVSFWSQEILFSGKWGERGRGRFWSQAICFQEVEGGVFFSRKWSERGRGGFWSQGSCLQEVEAGAFFPGNGGRGVGVDFGPRRFFQEVEGGVFFQEVEGGFFSRKWREVIFSRKWRERGRGDFGPWRFLQEVEGGFFCFSRKWSERGRCGFGPRQVFSRKWREREFSLPLPLSTRATGCQPVAGSQAERR